MEVHVDRDAFMRGLQMTHNVVEPRQTLPVLANVLLEAQGDTLRMTATDLEVSVRVTGPAKVVKPGTITISARKLMEIVKELPTACAQDQGQAATEDILTSDPDVTAIYAACGPPALGAATAIGNAGIADDAIILVGFDALPEQIVQWTLDDRWRLLVSSVVIVAGLALLIVFYAGLRAMLGRAEGAPALLATIGYGSFLVVVTLALISVVFAQMQAVEHLALFDEPRAKEALARIAADAHLDRLVRRVAEEVIDVETAAR